MILDGERGLLKHETLALLERAKRGGHPIPHVIAYGSQLIAMNNGGSITQPGKRSRFTGNFESGGENNGLLTNPKHVFEHVTRDFSQARNLFSQAAQSSLTPAITAALQRRTTS